MRNFWDRFKEIVEEFEQILKIQRLKKEQRLI